jgi:uncharacterized protein YaeQ
MALKATIFKAELNIADMDRGYYQDHQLTLALHPSETKERLIVRLLAFALNANQDIIFCKGLSDDDEPDLWQKNLNGEIELWIDVGMPDEKRIRKACHRAKRVIIYSYGGRNKVWWQQIRDKLQRFHNLSVINFPVTATDALSALVERSMHMQITIEDAQAWINIGQQTIHFHPEYWLTP